MTSSKRRTYSAAEASELAQQVVHHVPDQPRTERFVPVDRVAADGGVSELAALLGSVFPSIRRALRNASDSASYLSDDRLQGIAELIQNADDLGATHAYIAVDAAGSRLLFSHNGEGLTLHDVWALAIPWLSLKASDEEKLGRFGIGLKTLQSLSSVLEVSEGHFNVRFDPDTLAPLSEPILWPANRDATNSTVFAVPFTPGALRSDDVASWLGTWGEAGMVFLRSLSRIALIDEAGQPLASLRVDHGEDESLDLPHGRAMRRTVTTSDGRRWAVYARRAATPEGAERAGKAQGSLTPVALALPQFAGDKGHLHVGLPVREIGLPFRVLAQFDPQANRRDIADTEWNLALIPLAVDLWLDAALDSFQRDAAGSWALVPLASEFADDERTTGHLRDAFETHLMADGRRAFAAALRLDGGNGPLSLGDLAYEVPELSGLLSMDDVRQVSETKGAIAESVRSADGQWRRVLDDLYELDAATPYLVEVDDALTLLDDDQRPPAFVAALVGVAVKEDEKGALSSHRCLVLHDGSRAAPEERGSLEVLVPSDANELWAALRIGSRLHEAFAQTGEWPVIRDWLQDEGLLRTDASAQSALRVLSQAGELGERLPDPLTDTQLDAIRRALEPLDDANRQEFGRGIGQAIQLDGVQYDESGTRVPVHVRPADAYVIEGERAAWSVAAGRTPGLVWMHRRYTTDLKRDAGGIGAQRLFRILGAESAPRLIKHPANHDRYPGYPHAELAVPRGANGSPARRRRLMDAHGASYTVSDWSSPDLDAVLANIAAEKSIDQRRRRGLAVLGTLSRAWDRLSDYATVMAALDNYGWVNKGQIEAWWISSAGSIPWLTSENRKPTAPDDLWIRSGMNVLFHGDDPALFLDHALDAESYREVLAQIGVAGDPTVGDLIDKLEEVRAETLNDPTAAQDDAAPIYQALAAEVRGTRLGQLTRETARERFGRGQGLIATSAGWRRPTVVFAGPPRFGLMRDFVPSVSGTERLWSLLGIAEPSASVARNVLAELSRAKRADPMVMLEALRLLAAAPPNPADKKGTLRRSAVWVGDRWMSDRPVFAISNPLVAEALKDRLAIWTPGGALSQFESLIEPYGLTRLDTPNGQVLAADSATYEPDLTQVFLRAVANLRADLSESDPKAEETLSMSWDELADFRVAVLPDLRVRLVEAIQGTDVTVSLDAWLDSTAGTLYVTEDDAAGKPNAGGYAVAAAFGGDSRRISHDWVAAWLAAHDGFQAELKTTATRLDAERKRERDAASDERLKALAERSKNKRQEQKAQPKRKSVAEPAGGQSAPARPPRLLVDPYELGLHNEDGELVGGTLSDGGKPRRTGSTRPPGGRPKPPRPDEPNKPPKNPKAPTNYSPEERERVGLDLVRRILGGDEQAVIDIRHQHNVGADAIDELRNFYELKVHSGPIPDVISLTRDEYQRAKETDDFFLVVVGNVEQGEASPEVLIVTDPLGQLEMKPSGSVSLAGVKGAKALRYTFRKSLGEESQDQPSGT